MLNADTRALIARALGLLGSACIALGEMGKGEEVLRLGVQYAGDGSAASDIYFRLGESMLGDARPGEAIGPLRRAANLGAPGDRVWPMLAQALLSRSRYVAAFSAVLEAKAAGASHSLWRRSSNRSKRPSGRPSKTGEMPWNLPRPRS